MKKRQLVLGGVAAAAVGAGVAWRSRQEPAGSVMVSAGDTTSGTAVSDFWLATVERPDRTALPLKTLQGKPLIVNFWATWCPPCVREMPMLDRVYRAQTGASESSRWQFLGLAADRREAVARFLEQQPIAYLIALAGMEGIALSRALGNASGSLPYTVAFSAQGVVLHQKLGELSESELLGWMASIR